MHFGFQISADAELIVQENTAKLFHTTSKALHPWGGADESVGRANVEHEVSIQDWDDKCRRYVLSKQYRVTRVRAAVTSDED
jgi:hypothetical protein